MGKTFYTVEVSIKQVIYRKVYVAVESPYDGLEQEDDLGLEIIKMKAKSAVIPNHKRTKMSATTKIVPHRTPDLVVHHDKGK